jgi:predicted RNA-binding protein YlxR (DUF448 family)
MRPRRVPLRKCVACQEMSSKKELIRIVKTPEDEILVDFSGKKSGRGAYLCGSVKCLKLAKKSRALDRALKHSISADIYDQLEEQWTKANES